MKTILLWDPRFPDRRPARLIVEDVVASAAVRAGVAAAANPAEAGALSAGAALDPTMLTEVVLQHGNGGATRRVFLPYSVVMVGALAGVLAAIGTPIPGGVTPTPSPTPMPGMGANTEPQALSTENEGFALSTFAVPGYANVGEPYSLLPAQKGGVGNISWVAAGLPSGLALNNVTGEVTGTPTQAGNLSGIQLTCTDSTGAIAKTQVFTIPVGATPTVIQPSGDATGVADLAAINAAFAAGQSVRMADGATGAVWYINGPIVQPGNTALYLPSRQILLVAQSNTVCWRNKNQDSRTRVDKNISIVGPGNTTCIMNGNGANQTRQPNQRNNQAFVAISVENMQIRGRFRCRANASGFHYLGVYLGELRDAYADQVAYTNGANHDGFDLGNGSSFIHVNNYNGGIALDDGFSYYAKAAQSENAMMGSSPWSAGADVTDIIQNGTATGCGLNNMFRLQAGDGFKFLRMFVKDADNLAGGVDKRLIQFGESTFLATRGTPEDMQHIYFTGSAKLFNRLIAADSNFSYVTLKNVSINKLLTTILSTPDSPAVQYHHVTIDGITEINPPLAHTTGFSASRANSVISAIRLRNWSLGSITTLFSSAVTTGVQDLAMENITFASGNPAVTSSPTSTGTMKNLTAAGAVISPGASGLTAVN